MYFEVWVLFCWIHLLLYLSFYFVSLQNKNQTRLKNWALYVESFVTFTMFFFFGIRGLCANLGVKKMTARTWHFYDLESMMVFFFFHFEIFNTFSITFVGICVFEFDDCQMWKKNTSRQIKMHRFEGKTFDIIDMDSHQDFNRNVKKNKTTFGIFEMLKFTFPIHAISHIHLTKNNNIEIYRKQQNDKYWSTLMTFREDNVIKNKLFESKWYKWKIEGFFGKKKLSTEYVKWKRERKLRIKRIIVSGLRIASIVIS